MTSQVVAVPGTKTTPLDEHILWSADHETGDLSQWIEGQGSAVFNTGTGTATYRVRGPELTTIYGQPGSPDPVLRQTASLWAQVKAELGWEALRIVVTRDGNIVAGVQVLLRRLPLVGAIGYVARGPLCVADDSQLAKVVIDALRQVARDRRIQYLIVQPACNGDAIARRLPDWGFRPGPIEIANTATVLIDLTQDLEDIMRQMSKKTRRNIRRGLRRGIIVRDGTEDDLPAFYRLMLATSRRQGFSPYPLDYFATFKLKYGGQVTVYPGAYEYIGNPVLRWAHSAIVSRVLGSPDLRGAVRRAADTVRGVRHGRPAESGAK